MSSIDKTLSWKVGLHRIKISRLKDYDAFDDLNDIDYLAKLESKNSRLIKNLSGQGLIPKNPEEKLSKDYERIKKLRDYFVLGSSSKTLGNIRDELDKIIDRFSNSEKPFSLDDISNAKTELSNLKDLFTELLHKALSIYDSEEWSKDGIPNKFLSEFHSLKTSESFIPNKICSLFKVFSNDPTIYESHLQNAFSKTDKILNLRFSNWKSAKEVEGVAKQFFKDGKVDNLKKELLKSKMFADLLVNEKIEIANYDDQISSMSDLREIIKKLLFKSKEDPDFAFSVSLKVDEFEDKFTSFKKTAGSVHEYLKSALALEDFESEIQSSIKSVRQTYDLEVKKRDKIKRNKLLKKALIFILVVLVIGGGARHVVEEQKKEKLLKLKQVSDALEVTIEQYQSALQSYTLPSDYTGWWVHLEKGLTPDEDIPWGIFEIKNGQKNGRFTKFFFDKLQKAETGFYENNKLHGDFTKWRVDGIMSEQGTFKNGEKVGEWKYFLTNDKCTIQTHRTNEEVIANEIKLFGLDETQFKNALRSYSQPSKLNGWWIQTKGGQSLAIYEMSGAVKNGRYVLLHEDPDKSGFRKKKEEGNFMLGYKNGKTTSFYKNGMISSSGFYRMGEKVGGWVFTSENGEETIKQFGKLPSDFIKVNEKLLKPLTSLNLDNEESLNEIKLGLNKVSLEFEFVHKQGFFKSKKKEIFSTESFLLQDKKFIFTLVHSLDGPFQIDGKLKSIESVKARIKGSDLKEEIIIKEVAFMDDGRILIIPLPLSLTDSVIQNSQIKIFEFSDISSKEKCFIIDKNNEANLLHLSKDPNDSRYLRIDSEVDLPKGAHIFSKERKMVGIVLNRSFAFSIANLGGRIKSGSRILMNNAFNKLDTENLIFELESLYKTLDSRFQ